MFILYVLHVPNYFAKYMTQCLMMHNMKSAYVFVPRFRESVGTLNLIRPSVCLSVCPSVTKTLTLAITFALLQIEL